MANKVTFEDGTPVDEKGVPLIKISFSQTEKVPTSKYGNVTVGPATATRYVPDGDEKHVANAIADLAKPVEWALGHRRDQIMKSLGLEKDVEE